MAHTFLNDSFVFVDHASGQATSETRKKIRSRAAKHSHAVGRQSQKAARLVDLNAPYASPILQRPGQDRQASDESISTCNSSSNDLTASHSSLASTGQHHQSIRPPMNNGLALPVPEQDFYQSTIVFMWKWMEDAWKMFNVGDAERAAALVWVQQLTLTCPAYFYMNMLSCCTSLVEQGLLAGSVVPWLMAKTIQAINNALSSQAHMLDVGVLMAVGRIALWECMRGNLEIGMRVHRPAHARMLSMAGGLDALDIPPLVKAHMLWAERIVSGRTGVSILDLDPHAMKADALQTEDFMDHEILEAYYLVRCPTRQGSAQPRS